MNGKKKLALLGAGRLGRLVAEAWGKGLLPQYDLVGIYSRTAEKAQALAGEVGSRACGDLAELLAQEPDYVVEATSIPAAKELALPVLESGAELIVLSTGAFADEDFYRQAAGTAESSGGRVHLVSGAIGGMDSLQTLTLMAQATGETGNAVLTLRKTPEALAQTSLAPAGAGEEIVYTGTAREIITLLKGVNIAVTAALATTGAGTMPVQVLSAPAGSGPNFSLAASVDSAQAKLDFSCTSPAVAAWSAVALLRDLASPISLR